MKHVITVEGFGGYPFGQKIAPPQVKTVNDLIRGSGFSQMLNFIVPRLDPLPDVKWYYFSQIMGRKIIRTVNEICEKSPNDPIGLIGFSYGGATVHRIAHHFAAKRDGIVFQKVISLDPVGKWRINVAPKDPDAYHFSKPKSVESWINLYQRIDQCSFAPGKWPFSKPIWGGKVKGADWERELVEDDFLPINIYNNGVTGFGFPEFARFSHRAHLWFLAQNFVLDQVLQQFGQHWFMQG